MRLLHAPRRINPKNLKFPWQKQLYTSLKLRVWPSLLFIGVLALDFLSKFLVKGFLPHIQWGTVFPYGGIPIFHQFFGVSCAIVHTTNTGAAWGLFTSIPYLLAALRLLAAAFLIWKAFREPRRCIFLLLIAVGALGNSIDTFIYGHVVDMILFNFGSYTYPIFNVADSCICIGVGLLVLQSLFRRHEPLSAN